MISVSTDYDNIIANGGHYEWKIVNGNKTIDGDLKSGSLSLTLFEQASIGNVLAAQLDFEYFDDGVSLDLSNPLVLSFRAVSGSSQSEWLTKGTFYIDTIEQSPYSDVVKVTAFDSLLKGNVPWMKTGTFASTTDLAIVQGIASDIGVSIDSATLTDFATPITISEAPSIGANGTTSLEMLSYIGVMHGGNWIIDSANELKLIKLFSEQETGAASTDIGDSVEDFDASPAEPIVGVCIWNSENNYFRVPNVTDEQWKALVGRIIDAKCYIGGTQELAQSLYDALSGKNYYPYTTNKAWVDLKYELGDGITIKDVDSVICDQTINLTALGSCSLNAKGRDIVTSNYPVPTPVEREIARQDAKTQAYISVLSDRIDSVVSQEEGLTLRVSSLEQTSDGIRLTLETKITEEQAQQITDNSLDAYAATMAEYIEYVNGVLRLGSTTSGYTVELTPTKLSFLQDGYEVAYVSNNKLYITTAEITESLQIGHYRWVSKESGRMSLVWVD